MSVKKITKQEMAISVKTPKSDLSVREHSG